MDVERWKPECQEGQTGINEEAAVPRVSLAWGKLESISMSPVAILFATLSTLQAPNALSLRSGLP